MTTTRARQIAASRAAVWEILADPYHRPRWWPRVAHVESVRDAGWTNVMRTQKGHAVRADFRITESVEPERLAWEQELVNTPFERIMTLSEFTVELEEEGAGACSVRLRWRQQLRGFSRFGGWMVRRAARRQLDEALTGLAALVE